MSAQAKSHSWALKAFFSLTILSWLFKVMHWPYDNYLGLVAAVILLIFYPLRYMDKENKELLDHVKIALALLVSANGIFHLEHLLYFQLATLALFGFWFFHEGFFYLPIKLDFWNQQENQENVLDDFSADNKPAPYNYKVDWIYATGIILLILGAGFKLLHWPGADEFIIVGVCLLSMIIWFKKI